MYNHAPENYACPLCQIANGEVTDHGSQESTVIFRDDLITVYVAGKWLRSNPGHIIIMPNRHFENLYDLPEKFGHRIFDASKAAAIAFKKADSCGGVSTRQHNEPAGDQSVLHFHLHVFPRYEGDDFYLNHNDSYWPPLEEVKARAEKLKPFFKL